MSSNIQYYLQRHIIVVSKINFRSIQFDECHWELIDVSRVFLESVLKMFEGVSREFKRCAKGVSRVFPEGFQGVSRVFRGCFNEQGLFKHI